jgi:hypothetical protein
MSSLPYQPATQLARRRRLPGALQAEECDNPRRFGRVLQSTGSYTKQRHHLVPDDFHNMLSRRQAAQYLLIDRAHAHTIDKGLRNLEVDVSLEQRKTDFAQRRIDGVFREPRFPPERSKGVLEPVTERFEHAIS